MTTLAPREIHEIDFGTGRRTDDHPYLRLVPNSRPVGDTPDEPVAKLEDFYPEGFEHVGELGSGLKVLSEAIDHLDAALSATIEGRTFEGDDLAIRSSRCALDGFRYTTIGNGWGALLVAVHAAIRNRDEALTVTQLEELARVCRELRLEPSLSEERAIDAIERLEAVDLQPTPEAFVPFAELTDETQ